MNHIYVKAEKTENSLILSLIDRKGDEECGVRALEDYRECEPDWQSDETMYEFFEGFIANSEWEWIAPEEIGALTDAPILGIRDENEKVIEAYGYMDYAVKSLLSALVCGEVILQKG